MTTDATELFNRFLGDDRLMPEHLEGKVAADGGRKCEKPWHRQAALLTAAGWSPHQIADFVGVGVESVRSLLRTPWFQSEVTMALEANGGKDMIALFKKEVFNAHVTLCEMRDDPKTPPAVKAGICRDMIERIYGKATQRIETSDTVRSTDPVQEVARLEEENTRLRAAQTPSLS